jgi:hypothetical protein
VRAGACVRILVRIGGSVMGLPGGGHALLTVFCEDSRRKAGQVEGRSGGDDVGEQPVQQ